MRTCTRTSKLKVRKSGSRLEVVQMKVEAHGVTVSTCVLLREIYAWVSKPLECI